MSNNYKVMFFIGKGGVGKTTMAAAYSLKTARKGLRTIIVSLDPAHNLGDVLDTKLGDEPVKITENLYAVEVDYDKMIRKHLKILSDKIKDIYGYLRIFNLEKYIDVLQHSPGIEEQASLDKIIEIIKEFGDKRKFNIIVFDTPPTGLMLRIMALPFISLIWIEKLLELRLAILERRRAISKLTGEKFEVEIAGKKINVPIDVKDDPVFKELTILRKEYSWINKLFGDHERTIITLIINPETLPVLEAYRAKSFLEKIGISVKYIIINKLIKPTHVPEEFKAKIIEQEKALKLAHKYFKTQIFVEVPYLPREPRGLGELVKFSKMLNIE